MKIKNRTTNNSPPLPPFELLQLQLPQSHLWQQQFRLSLSPTKNDDIKLRQKYKYIKFNINNDSL